MIWLATYYADQEMPLSDWQPPAEHHNAVTGLFIAVLPFLTICAIKAWLERRR